VELRRIGGLPQEVRRRYLRCLTLSFCSSAVPAGLLLREAINSSSTVADSTRRRFKWAMAARSLGLSAPSQLWQLASCETGEGGNEGETRGRGRGARMRVQQPAASSTTQHQNSTSTSSAAPVAQGPLKIMERQAERESRALDGGLVLGVDLDGPAPAGVRRVLIGAPLALRRRYGVRAWGTGGGSKRCLIWHSLHCGSIWE
jgi:hypothetical protein